MSKTPEFIEKNTEFKDLPSEEPLTQEEKEQLAGAGRFRPSFEALEERYMMSASPVLVPAAPEYGPGLHSAPGDRHSSTSEGSDTKPAYLGSSDASAAVFVRYKAGNGDIRDGVLVGDDKSDVIRLYDTRGGAPVNTFDITSFTGKPTSDIEAAARIGKDTICWMTSSGKVFVTQMTFDAEGNFSQLTFDKTIKLNGAIRNAGANINVLANGKGMTLAAAMNEAEKPENNRDGKDGKNWFNLEAFGVGPDGTAYIGFRAPLSNQNGNALILPVTNFPKLLAATPAAGTLDAKDLATFGGPITLNFRDGNGVPGRGIRDIVWSPEMGKFLILAGNYGVKGATDPQGQSTKLFAWDGPSQGGFYKSAGANTQVTYLAENHMDPEGKFMSYEGIGRVTNMGNGRFQVQLLSDDGGSKEHGKTYEDNTERAFTERYFYGEFVDVSI